MQLFRNYTYYHYSTIAIAQTYVQSKQSRAASNHDERRSGHHAANVHASQCRIDARVRPPLHQSSAQASENQSSAQHRPHVPATYPDRPEAALVQSIVTWMKAGWLWLAGVPWQAGILYSTILVIAVFSRARDRTRSLVNKHAWNAMQLRLLLSCRHWSWHWNKKTCQAWTVSSKSLTCRASLRHPALTWWHASYIHIQNKYWTALFSLLYWYWQYGML